MLSCSSWIEVLCFVVGELFFFKQKTAYELRISDWSSDVCSSDLDHVARAGNHRGEELVDALPESAVQPLPAEKGEQRTLRQQDEDHEDHRPVRRKAGRHALDHQAPDQQHHRQQEMQARLDRRSRSEERREGKECVSTCRSRWSP